jgi:hypothetical protein
MLGKLLEMEWPTVKQAPVTFSVVLLVGLGVGITSSYWFYKDRMDAQNERMVRIRIAAGLDKAPSKTALTDLTNLEIKQKASRLVERIREIVSIHHEHVNNLKSEKESTKWSEDKYRLLSDLEMQRSWKQFEVIRVDALMVSDELRARLSPHVHEKIVTATPHFRSADDPKAELTISRLATGPFLVDAAIFLASEIEELSKLQLDRLQPCAC